MEYILIGILIAIGIYIAPAVIAFIAVITVLIVGAIGSFFRFILGREK